MNTFKKGNDVMPNGGEMLRTFVAFFISLAATPIAILVVIIFAGIMEGLQILSWLGYDAKEEEEE